MAAGSVAGSSVTHPSMSETDATADGPPPLSPPFKPPPAPPRWRPRRGLVVVAVILIAGALVAIGLGVGGPSQVKYYAITPGDATPVAPLISVPAKLDHPLKGQILLTDVYLVGPLNTDSYKSYKSNKDDDVVPTDEILGPTPAGQFLDQGFLQMSQAQSDATVAALTRLGYKVNGSAAGLIVYGITPNAPAKHVLQLGQIITKVNNTPTPTQCALLTELHTLAPGTTATLSVEQSSLNGTGAFVPGPVVQRTVTLGRAPKEAAITDCGPSFVPTAYLGIETTQQVNWDFPVKVTVHTANIGGPSAGLAMALGIKDKLSGGHLTGGLTVAATGTIDQNGLVGDVGGVAQKTIAVERAGATVFFVPPEELGAAKSKATKKLHVYAVANLDQALSILKQLGGTIPANHVAA